MLAGTSGGVCSKWYNSIQQPLERVQPNRTEEIVVKHSLHVHKVKSFTVNYRYILVIDEVFDAVKQFSIQMEI